METKFEKNIDINSNNYFVNMNGRNLLEFLLKKCDDMEVIKHVIEHSVESEFKENEMVFMIFKTGNIQLINFVLDKNYDLNKINLYGKRWSPIHLLIFNNAKDDKLIKKLLKKKIILTDVTIDGFIPINLIFKNCNLTVIKYVFKNNLYDVTKNYEMDNSGFRPLQHLFVRKDLNLEFFKFLLNFEINFFETNSLGWTSFHCIIFTQTKDMINLLLKKINLLKLKKIDVNAWLLNSNEYDDKFSIKLRTKDLIKFNNNLTDKEKKKLIKKFS